MRVRNASGLGPLRRCTKCGEIQVLDNFHFHKKSQNNRQGICRTCANKKSLDRWHLLIEDPDFLDERKAQKYGLSLVELRQLQLRSEGRCKICQGETRLVIDHDHNSGQVRGLLCDKCNTAIGLLGDSRERLLAAAEYLNVSPETNPDVGD